MSKDKYDEYVISGNQPGDPTSSGTKEEFKAMLDSIREYSRY